MRAMMNPHVIIALAMATVAGSAKVGREEATRPEVAVDDNVGTFWHITDMHFDLYYNPSARNLTEVCPSSSGAAAVDPGPWGDYRCDAPWKLIESAVFAMKEIHPHPNFIIWTGDDTLHVAQEDEDAYLGEDLVSEIIANQSRLLAQVFPDTPVFASLGNHDYHPKNQMPPGSNSILSNVADVWCDLFRLAIDSDQCENFRSAGFYSGAVHGAAQLHVMSLNTLVWYSSNLQVNGTGDPNQQFLWMEDFMVRAREENIKVFIIGHIPPGFFELVDYKYWFYSEFNRRYVEFVRRHHDVIVGQFFGHHHTDSYRMFYDATSKQAISTMFLAPGVTPWMTTLPGAVDAANNPGVRLFQFDKTSLRPTDFTQYFLDLAKATSDGVAEWQLEYRATQAYVMRDVSVASMQNLTRALASCDDVDCDVMRKFALHNSVSYSTAECDARCRLLHVCAITHVEHDAYRACVTSRSTLHRVTWSLVVAAAALTLLVVT